MLDAQPCLTLGDHMDCSPPRFSIHGILQARILEWVAFPFSRGFSQPRDQTRLSCTAGRFTLGMGGAQITPLAWTPVKCTSLWLTFTLCHRTLYRGDSAEHLPSQRDKDTGKSLSCKWECRRGPRPGRASRSFLQTNLP